MTAIVTTGTRLFGANQLKAAFADTNPEKNYIFIGKSTPWADDAAPPTPISSCVSDVDTRRDLLGMKLVTEADVALGVIRRDWVSGQYYDFYRNDYGEVGIAGVNLLDGTPSAPTSIFETNHYVITDEYNVYLCIWNNGGQASLNKPTGTSTSKFTTADGYVWKFMYQVSPSDVVKFVSTNFIPVRQLDSNPGVSDPYYSQWQVQEAAVAGQISRLVVTNGGTGYPTSATFPVTIIGDGVGASATVTTNSSGVISSATVTDQGTGYSWATVSISGGVNGAAKAILSPNGGFGYEATTQLGAHYLLISSRLAFDEGDGDFPQSNEYRRIGIIKGPTNYGTSTLSTSSTLNPKAGMNLVIGVTGTFTLNETVTGGTSGATATVVTYDSVSRAVRFVQPGTQRGTFQVGETITGGSSGAIGVVASMVSPEVNIMSGDLVYLEHRRPITRQADQIEDIKFTIES